MKDDLNHKKKRKYSILKWILIGLLALIFAFISVLLIQMNSIVNHNLSKFIYEKTDSLYRLEFSNLDINLFNKSVLVSNIELKPDTTTLSKNRVKTFDFKANSIKIEDIKLMILLRERRFVASNFKIEKPEFKYTSGEKLSINNLSENKLNVGDTLKIPVFSEILFDTVQIINAQLNIDTLFNLDYALPQINVVANHFKIGGRKFTPTPYPFDVSDLSLTIDNFKENLPDELHKVSIKQVRLSLLHSTINADNVELSPINDTLGLDKNHYRIKVPQIQISSDQISKLHPADTISFDKVDFTNPEIEIKFGSNTKSGTPPNEIDFYQLTGNKMNWIKIKHFSIANADVKFIPPGSEKTAQHFEQLFINFYDFKIDSTSYKEKDRILSAKDVNLSLTLFTLFHTDNIHEFTIQKLKVDTRTQHISTGEVAFKPIDSANEESNTLINVSSSGLVCRNVNFLDFYHIQQLPMDELTIKNPEVTIKYQQSKSSIKKEKDNSLVIEKTKDYLSGIYVGTALIQNGNIEYNYRNINNKEGFIKTGYNFELNNLSVDSATFSQSDKIFFAENFKVNFNDLNVQLADNTHRLLTKSIELSSLNRSADIVDLRVIPTKELDSNDTMNYQNETELFDIRFPRIHLNGANLHKAFFDKKLYVNNFAIYNPVFNIEKYGEWKTDDSIKTPYQNTIYSLVSDFLYNVNIRNLNMENGTLNLIHKKKDEPIFELSNLFSIRLMNFELDENSSNNKEKLFFSDDIDLILKDHSFTLADGVHKLDADEIGILSSEKRVYIKDGSLYPDILSKKFKKLPVTVFADIPYMQITDADVFDLFNKGNLPVGDIVFNKPNIRLLFQNKKEKGVKTVQKPLLMLKDFKSASANKIKIIDGYLEFSSYDNFKNRTIANANVNFELSNFIATNNNGKVTSSYSNFSFDLGYLHFDIPDSTHQLDIAKISYQLSTKNLSIKNLALRPKSEFSQKEKEQFFNLDIPEIELENINIKDFLNTKNIATSEVNVSHPYLKIVDNRIDQKKGFSPFNLNLYTAIKSFSKSIHIDKINLANSEINLETDSPFRLRNIDATLTNFEVSENSPNNNKLLNSNEVDITVNAIGGKTKGNYYFYNIDEFSINEKGNFKIKNLSLTPSYSAEEFAKRKEFQADYFSIKNVNLSGYGLNIKELIERKNILLPTLEADFTDVKIHRDKRFPLQPNLKTKLPQEALRDLELEININKARILANNFVFTEKEKNTSKNNMVFVNNLRAEIDNITNIKQDLLYNPFMHANIKGLLMGAGDVNIDMNLNVKSLGNEFTFEAQCGPMELSKLNPITEPGLKLSIKEGFNNSMQVYFEANEDSSVGNIRFNYNDLKISVLSNRDGEMKEGKFISFLVNSIALKTDNPKPGRILIPAKFENHRDKQRSVVGYCWRSIYAGIKSTMGIKEKEE